MGSSQDSSTPDFWDIHYREGRIPWDAGGVPRALRDYVTGTPSPGRVLVPGCGSAYEGRFFAEAGFDVLAIDFSPAAVKMARQTLEPWREAVALGDFFSYDFGDEPFAIVYERAFLCSLPRHLWPRYAMRVADVLRAGGRFLGYFFHGEEAGGPPFGLKRGELGTLLGKAFMPIVDVEVEDSVPIFAGKEHWQVWERSADEGPSRAFGIA